MSAMMAKTIILTCMMIDDATLFSRRRASMFTPHKDRTSTIRSIDHDAVHMDAGSPFNLHTTHRLGLYIRKKGEGGLNCIEK